MKITTEYIPLGREQEARMGWFIILYIIFFFLGIGVIVRIFGERNIISPILTMVWLIILSALVFYFEDKRLVIK